MCLAGNGNLQGCSKKFYQPGNHKLQAGSWLKKFQAAKRSSELFFSVPSTGSGGMLSQRMLKIKGLRLCKNAFLAFQRPYEVVKHRKHVFFLSISAM